MQFAFRAALVVAALVSVLGPARAQEQPASKGADKPEAAKVKPSLDKLKLPPGGVWVVVEDVKEKLALVPNLIIMSPEVYQNLEEKIRQLETLLKSERRGPHVCKLNGRLEGDFIVLRADFSFATEQPRAAVVLGLKGAHLTDEGELDGKPPVLEFTEEGYVVKVDKEGTHQLKLNLKLPVALKRTAAPGGSAERGFELGLPGAAVTILWLDLPGTVKEIRYNDTVEKSRVNNRWELALGKIKELNLSWKEPVSVAGSGPLLTAESQITIKLEEAQVLVNADIALEDLRGQTKEWRLLLPAHARIPEVKTPGGLTFKLLYPDAKDPHHVLQLSEPSLERILVNVQVSYDSAASVPRYPVGPFAVAGAYRQQGTITVAASPAIARSQRILFHRHGEIFQRDLPKGAAADVLALFHFWNHPGAGKNPKVPEKAPLEIELKSDKGLADTLVDHFLRIRRGTRGMILESITKIHVKSRQYSGDSILVQLPRTKIPSLGLVSPSIAPWPAALPWSSLPFVGTAAAPYALPVDFTCEDDGHGQVLFPADGQRRARVKWLRPPSKDEFSLVLTGRYYVPAGENRIRIDLPYPLGTFDKGGKATLRIDDDQYELIFGNPDTDGPLPEKQQVQASWEQAPESIDVGWKPYRRDFFVSGVADVTLQTLHERSAKIQQHISFVNPPQAAHSVLPHRGQLRLRVPAAVRDLKVTGGELLSHDPSKEVAWVIPVSRADNRAELSFDYDFELPQKEEGEPRKNAGRLIPVPLIWPENATRQEAKVRVWSDPGTAPVLVEAPFHDNAWMVRGTDLVPDRDTVPALVLHGSGLNLPLSLRLLEHPEARLASLVSDRSLIQVTIDEEGNHHYRVRYVIRKLSTRHLDLEFPLPAANCVQRILLDKHKINHYSPEPFWNIARIPVDPKLHNQPAVLDIEYKIPVSAEGQRFWTSTLHPPQFHGDVFVGRVRWQVSLPSTSIALATGGGLDLRWGLQGWLLGPESSVSSAELEAWLTGRDGGEAAGNVSLAFARAGQDSVQILHLPRQLWLLLCSGLVLAVGLTLYLLPMARIVFWLLLIGTGLGLGALTLVWPAWMPFVFYGCQPGLVVLCVLLGIQWTLQERYRRQLVFMPGFTRLKTNSSLIRNTGNGARPRDASTVDAPAPVPSPSAANPQAPSSQGS